MQTRLFLAVLIAYTSVSQTSLHAGTRKITATGCCAKGKKNITYINVSYKIVIISPTHAQFTSLLYTLAYMFTIIYENARNVTH
jgi:hypothetical protein